jgi:hypothetical protein
MRSKLGTWGRGFARRRRSVLEAALRLARAEVSDEDARLRLDEQTRKAPRAARRALKVLRVSRDEFDHDRAYRLLEASLTHMPVHPIKPDYIDRFSREEELGRKPICEAFDDLKKLVPELVELEATVEQHPKGLSQEDFAGVRHRIVGMVGPAVPEALDSLARSQLALTIGTQYLAILGGDSRYGDKQTPYFAAPHRLYVRAGVI